MFRITNLINAAVTLGYTAKTAAARGDKQMLKAAIEAQIRTLEKVDKIITEMHFGKKPEKK